MSGDANENLVEKKMPALPAEDSSFSKFFSEFESATQLNLSLARYDYLQKESSANSSLPDLKIVRTLESSPVASTKTGINSDEAKRPAPEIVSGNGFGYAVMNSRGELTRFLAHPYAYERAGKDPKSPGVDTLNFIDKMAWQKETLNHSPAPEIRYINESNIMESKNSEGKQTHFMPFDLKRNALITFNSGSTKELNIDWAGDEQEEKVNVAGRDVRLVNFKGTDGKLAMVPLDAGRPPQGWALLALDNRHELEKAVTDLSQWQKDLNPDQLVQRELENQEKWRKPPNVTFQNEDERKLWRQSETILRMAQISEENTETRRSNGMINASLSGDFVMPYVRDMAYATMGFLQMGHEQEARRALKSYFDAFPGRMQAETRKQEYQVSLVRYYGNGQEEVDYSPKKQTPNIEMDNWGLALWASSEYYQNTHDKQFLQETTHNGNTVYESMRDGVVKPLLANLDNFKDGKIVTKDSSNWEDHQENKKNFAHTTLTAIAGLRGFLQMARAMHDKESVDKVESAVADLEKGFQQAFIKNGIIRGSLQRSFHDTDSAVLEAFNLGVVKDPKVIEHTMKAMEELRMPSGGYRRVKGEAEYDKHEFLLIDFNMARLYFKLGKEQEGMALLNHIVKKANTDNGQIPELYVSRKNKEFPGEPGAPSGAIPMVGYGAGAYIMALRQRELYRKEQKTRRHH